MRAGLSTHARPCYLRSMFGTKKIEVSVAAYGLAAQQVKTGRYEVKAGSTVKAVLKKAGLSGAEPGMMLMIEGDRVELSRVMQDGEELKVFLLAAGG